MNEAELAALNQRFAIETQVTTLLAGGGQTELVVQVQVDAVQDDQAIGPRDHNGQ